MACSDSCAPIANRGNVHVAVYDLHLHEYACRTKL